MFNLLKFQSFLIAESFFADDGPGVGNVLFIKQY